MENELSVMALEGLITGDGNDLIKRQQKRRQQNIIRNERIPIKTNDMSIPEEIRWLGTNDDMEYEERTEILRKNNIAWTKQQYEKMGIKVIGEYDDLFYNVQLPEGWKVEATEHSMWNNLLDDKGRKRASFFYKAAFYDRDAFINFNIRFKISREIADYNEEMFEVKPEYIIAGHKEVYVDENGEEIKDGEFYFHYNDFYGDNFKKFTIRKTEKPIYKKNPDYIPLSGYEKYSQPFHFEVHDCDDSILFASDIVKTDFEYSKGKHGEFFDNRDGKKEFAANQCREWLDKNYPDWKDENAYWD